MWALSAAPGGMSEMHQAAVVPMAVFAVFVKYLLISQQEAELSHSGVAQTYCVAGHLEALVSAEPVAEFAAALAAAMFECAGARQSESAVLHWLLDWLKHCLQWLMYWLLDYLLYILQWLLKCDGAA